MKSSRGGGRNRGKHQRSTRNSGGSVNGMSFSGNPSNGTNSSNGYTTANSAAAQSAALSSAIAASKAKYPSYFKNTGNWSNTGASAAAALTSKAKVDAQVAKAKALSTSFNAAQNKYKAYFSNPSNSTQNISSSSMLNTSISKAKALKSAIATSAKKYPSYFKNASYYNSESGTVKDLAQHTENAQTIKTVQDQRADVYNEGQKVNNKYNNMNPDSPQVKAINKIIARQRAQREINAEQKKYFTAITTAPNAKEATKIRNAAMAQNPNIGTFNALYKGGELQSTSGTYGIGDGTVKDLNYKKFDRTTQTFAERKKLGNLTDSQGNVIASNLKSSEGVEWNFNPVSTEKEKILEGQPITNNASMFGSISQAPAASSSDTSYDSKLDQYKIDSTDFETNWGDGSGITTEAQYDQYTSEYDALNLQYEDISAEYTAKEKDYEEWGDYMQSNEKTLPVPTPTSGNNYLNAFIKSGSNTVAGISNIGIWSASLTDSFFGATTPKGLYREYYSTPVTNVESAVFGAAVGTASQGGTYWTSGQGGDAFGSEIGQVVKNYKRNPEESIWSTAFEASLYAPTAIPRIGSNILKGISKGLGKNTDNVGGAAAKGFTAPTPPKPKYTVQEILQAKKDWNLMQQGITNPSQAKINKLKLILKEAKNLDLPTQTRPPSPFSNKLPVVAKFVDDLPVNPKKTNVPTIFKIGDNLPVPKKIVNTLPVKPKDAPTSIKLPDIVGLPKRIAPSTITDLPKAPVPKTGKRGFVLPFGWPNFSGRSGGAGTGSSGKRQGRKRFTAWDTRTDKIGFYGFGRKSDAYGGVFNELDKLDKTTKTKKKVKSKEGFDEVFKFNFDF